MFITAGEIRSQTTFSEVADLSDGQIQGYIERADSWIRRATNRDFDETASDAVQRDMRVATLLLVEYLWFWDNPEVKEESMSNDEMIKLGSFTVNKREARMGEETGIPELDDILLYYKSKATAGLLFKVLRKD